MEAIEEKVNESRSQRDNTSLISELITSLSQAVVYSEPDNFQTNKKLWDVYAQDWDLNSPWVQNMAQGSSLPNETIQLEVLGDEWSPKTHLLEVYSDYIQPYLSSACVTAEIGSGGGRVSKLVAPHVNELHCFDISENMINHAKNNLQTFQNISFHLLTSPNFESIYNNTFDFIYSFDVFVHFDLHLIYKYFQQIYNLLKINGKVFISVANLLSKGGWDRFSKQKKFSVGGFYFVSPDIIKFLTNQVGFRIIKESNSITNSSNVYYNRDYLFVMEKYDINEQNKTIRKTKK